MVHRLVPLRSTCRHRNHLGTHVKRLAVWITARESPSRRHRACTARRGRGGRTHRQPTTNRHECGARRIDAHRRHQVSTFHAHPCLPSSPLGRRTIVRSGHSSRAITDVGVGQSTDRTAVGWPYDNHALTGGQASPVCSSPARLRLAEPLEARSLVVVGRAEVPAATAARRRCRTMRFTSQRVRVIGFTITGVGPIGRVFVPAVDEMLVLYGVKRCYPRLRRGPELRVLPLRFVPQGAGP